MQLSGVPGRQLPKVQASPAVQAFPSSQAAVLLAKTQPVAGSQLSVVHAFWSSHDSGVPMHAPPEQVSCDVHALPSVHAFTLFAWTQPASGSHVSVVQGLPSSHWKLDVQAGSARTGGTARASITRVESKPRVPA